jgi:SPX domain protein involved in polyphosphate accumulation
MKYGEYLRTHLTPEWSSQYLSYEDMKDMLTDTINKIDRSLSRQQYFLLADEEFLQVTKFFCFH